MANYSYRLAANAVLVLLLLCVSGCDKVNDSTIEIDLRTQASEETVRLLEGKIRDLAEQVVAEHGLQKSSFYGEESWIWENPETGPDFSVALDTSKDIIYIDMIQNLFGPMGKLPEYKAVEIDLVQCFAELMGEKNVRLHKRLYRPEKLSQSSAQNDDSRPSGVTPSKKSAISPP